MRPRRFSCRRPWAVAAILAALAATPAAAATSGDLRNRLYDWTDGVLVVAHRGCHRPAPSRGLPTAVPENSLAALDRCIALGVDMVEVDVRRTADGALVVMHDPTVDRTTGGYGRLASMTLDKVKALRLRPMAGRGGSPAAEAPPTLEEFLARAQGRILVNLDVKEPIAQAVADVVMRSGAAGQVLVKAPAQAGAPPLADLPPYAGLSFMPMVVRLRGAGARELGALTARQTTAENRIPAIELCVLGRSDFKAVRAAARLARVRLWSNTLSARGLKGVVARARAGGATADSATTWRRLIDDGVSVIQTDRPSALLDYLDRKGLRGTAPASQRASL
ncbi:glycerophosphodiester phosphodiesterase family protein [Caulobacter sp. LARHSG274]